MASKVTEEPLGRGPLLEPPRFVGTERFQVLRLLGQGGHGAVYEVRDAVSGDHAALKVLRQGNPAALIRFKQEFRALVDVTHPNLISLYELVSEADLWFFTMELVQGGGFLDYVWEVPTAPTPVAPAGGAVAAATRTWTSGALPAASVEPAPPRAFRLRRERLRPALVQLARGVLALHEAGKLHCDLKPSNVLVDGQGRLVLADFGLVTDLAHPSRGPGGWGGTPGYMPPEQRQGQPLSPASDWYGVGALLHEALTGRPPVDGVAEPVAVEEGDTELESLQALCVDLLRARPEERPSGAEVLRRLEDSRAPGVPVAVADESLRGRGPHLARLRAALEAMRAGRPVALRVVGPSGVGKSALVHRFLREAGRDAAGLLVLSGRCYEREAVPYNALDSLMDGLCRHLATLPAPEAAALLGAGVGGLARLFPVLRQLGPDVERASRTFDVPDMQELRRRAFAALRGLLERLAGRQPTVLFIDDVQWGDADSAWMLAEVLRPPAPPPLLLLASHRSDVSRSPFLQVFLREWAGFGTGLETDELHVGELSPRESETLAGELLGPGRDGALAREIAEESAGNPYFLQELVRGALAPGAVEARKRVSLEELLRQRLSRLSPAARHLMETVAVAGHPIPEAVAVEAADIHGRAGPALADLRAARLINLRSGAGASRVEPYHDRVRETVAAALSEETRRALHLRLAQTLERRGEQDLPALVEHFRAGGDAPRAGRYVLPAVDEAEKALAFELAARLYRLALELRPEGADPLRLRTGRAWALANAGRSGEAGGEFLAVAKALEALSPGEARVREWEQLAAEHFLRAGMAEEGRAVFRQVLTSVGLPYAPTPGWALLSVLKNRARLALRGMRFTPRPEAALSREVLGRLDVCWAAVVGHSQVDPLRSGDYQTQCTLLALEAGEPRRLVRVLSAEASYLASVGKAARKKRSQEIAELAFGLSGGVEAPDCRGYAHAGFGVRAFFCGEWKEAFERCDQAARIFRDECRGATWEIVMNAGVSHYALAYLGRFAELAHRGPRLLREIDEKGDVFGSATLRVGMHNQVWLALDQPEEAARRAEEGMARWPREPYTQQHSMHLIGLTELDLYREAPASAWHRLLEHWPRLRSALFFTRQFVRVELGYMRARCALAAAAGGGEGPKWTRARLLKDAAASVAALAREDFACVPAYVASVRAGLAAAQGRDEEAARHWETAAPRFTELHMACHAAAARHHRAVLARDTAAREAAEGHLRDAGVVRPERLARVLVPGAPR